jgi:hypothetical protein
MQVEKMWGSRGNGADALLKKILASRSDEQRGDFSEEPQKIPLNTARQKLNPGSSSNTFPRIHSAHHNKKRFFLCFRKDSCEYLL